MNLRITILFLFSVLLVAAAPLALAQGTYTQIDVPGATRTISNGINTAGEISGWYGDSSGRVHGFFLSGGTYTTIDYPGAFGTYLFGTNDVGLIVGTTSTGRGFVYDMPTQIFSGVRYPGADYMYPYCINNAGTIAGQFKHFQKFAGFELVNSTYSKIAPPGTNYTFVGGITALGKLVGDATLASHEMSFAFDQGKYRRIRIINAPEAALAGINSAGTAVVGSYSTSPGTSAGFVYQNKFLQTLQFPESTQTYANSINDAGEVVGTFVDISGNQHSFSWTPPAGAPRNSSQATSSPINP